MSLCLCRVSALSRADAGATCQVPHAPPLAAMRGRKRNKGKRECAVNAEDRSHSTDVVIIGSGANLWLLQHTACIGGLCCASLLAHYGVNVTVCEAHYHAGGAAHGFDVQGYKFDAGPSFHAGLSVSPSPNPLKQVLDIIGESVPCKRYDRWIVYDGKGQWECVANEAQYKQAILSKGGPEALEQMEQLEELMKPLQVGASMLPAAAIRDDLCVLLSAGYFGISSGGGLELAQSGLKAGKLTGPFGNIVDQVVTNQWLRQFIDLECFVLSGMLAKDTITAEMAFMFQERNKPGSTIDYPMGGSAALIDALVRGITKRGGKVLLRSAVEEVVMESGRAVGVRLKSSGGNSSGEVIRASKSVVSNASVWDTQKLLPEGTAPDWAQAASDTPAIESFMHLHLGIDATGLPEDLQCHHLVVNDWDNIDSTQNVSIVSIPTVFDPSLAPDGKAVVHAYTAANEPWEIWEGVQRGTDEYVQLKHERAQGLWKALERVIPDIRERTEVELVGTPLTHQRYLRRYKGTYGPAISAAESGFPRATTPVPGLLGCGDSYLPGIGVPAAAASGMIAANTLVPVQEHVKLLSKLKV